MFPDAVIYMFSIKPEDPSIDKIKDLLKAGQSYNRINMDETFGKDNKYKDYAKGIMYCLLHKNLHVYKYMQHRTELNTIALICCLLHVNARKRGGGGGRITITPKEQRKDFQSRK